MVDDQAFQAQAVHEDALLARANVVGVGVGFRETNGELQDDVGVIVLVEQKKPKAALSPDELIPPELEGLRTDVIEIGQLRAYQSPRERYRPIIPNGVSIGHYKVTAGTLGTIVRDRATGARLILSNNHVLANSNDAAQGDPVLQPATMDGGSAPADVVARLERFVPLRYVDDPVDAPAPTQPSPTQPNPTQPGGDPGTPQPPAGCNLVSIIAALANLLVSLAGSDKRLLVATQAQYAQAVALAAQTANTPPAALDEAARRAAALQAAQGSFPLTNAVGQAAPRVPENRLDAALARPTDPHMFSDDVRGIGLVNETKAPALGMRVRKSGRTTDYTEGRITLLNATVNVGYATSTGPRTARLVGQVICESMSQGGDSGALVVDAAENKAVGLLFAGSNLATIFTPIDVVLQALDITL